MPDCFRGCPGVPQSVKWGRGMKNLYTHMRTRTHAGILHLSVCVCGGGDPATPYAHIHMHRSHGHAHTHTHTHTHKHLQPFYYLLERGEDPVTAYQKTHDQIMLIGLLGQCRYHVFEHHLVR